ncbi:MAG TPA: hypothetical protein VK112_11620, partial [Fodinibius sp.]|nr:hypothetical protein [Fodinibius sp.]
MLKDFIIIILSCFFLFVSLTCYGQGQIAPVTDSLRGQLQNTSGEQHIEVLLELSGQLRRSDVDSAMAYARRALAESQQMANE